MRIKVAALAILASFALVWGVACSAPSASSQTADFVEVESADVVSPSVSPSAAPHDDTVNETVKAGVFAFDGYHMRDEDGNYYGYGIEVLELISKYSHLNFDLVGYDASWSEMLDMLERGEIDLVTSASKTPEREAKFDYSLPIGNKNTILSVAVDDNRFVTGNYATYDGIVVGEIPGNTQNDIFAEFAQDKGFDFTAVEFEDNSALIQALQNGEVDAILTSDLRKRENEKTLDSIEDDNYYVIVRKGETKLLDEINFAIEQMNLSEGDWKNTLYYKYYGPSYSSELEFTEREQAYIDAVRAGEKTISATAFSDRRPYSFAENGELRGILLDYFAAVMDVAELPYEIIVPANLEEYEQLIASERVNVVLDGITGGSHASPSYFDASFSSDVFMTASVVQVTRNDFSGEVETIAVADSSTGSLDEFLDSQDGKRLVHYPNREDALQAVLDGKADCAYVYVYTAQEFMNRDLTNGLSYTALYDFDIQFDILVSAHTDHELVNILNKCIKRVPEATLNQLVSEYTSYNAGDVTFGQFLQANPVIIFAICLLVLLVIAIIVGLIIREKWSQRLIASQEKSNRDLKEQLSIVEALSRDYANVFSVDEKTGLAKIVKLDGYVTEGLEPGTDKEYDYTSILNTYIENRVHPEDKQALLDELSLENVRARMTDKNEYQGTYRTAVDGESHNFQYTYILVDDDGGNFILAGFRNIDEAVRKNLEQTEVLSKALAQAQYANIAKTTFLNSMSHDIRTPMNAIIGCTTLATTHIDDKEQVRSYLDKIMTSSNHLLDLINDVLDMSRIESGKVKIESNEANLSQIMDDLRTIVHTDAEAKDISFDIEMQDVTNDTVICDKLRLNQVLLNIISNAIKYTKAGGSVNVIVSQTATDPEAMTAEYRFVVRDTGIGMSKVFLEHVFEPFEREETATVSGIQGTGLGLAITKNIIDLMDGTIEVTSEEGKGSEFVVSLRLPYLADDHTSAGSGGATGMGAPDEDIKDAFDDAQERLSGLRVLLAEDNLIGREIATTVLEDAGVIVDAVEDGKFAVERMEQMPAGTYDIVLTDVQMPIMDGYETTRAIRALEDPEKAAIPIIAVTANAFEEDRKEAEDAGMSGYIPKPIDVNTLFTVLEEIMGK